MVFVRRIVGEDKASPNGAGYRAVGVADRTPDNLVEQQVVVGVLFGEIHLDVAAPGMGGTPRVGADVGWPGHVKVQTGRGLEGVIQGTRRRIETGHGLKAENQRHSPQHAGGRVQGRINRPAADGGADGKGNPAIRIHVVRAVLGVAFEIAREPGWLVFKLNAVEWRLGFSDLRARGALGLGGPEINAVG